MTIATWPDALMGGASPRRLWRRYVVALGLVLALLVTSHVASVAAMTGGEEAATVINVAGRQRMLSQRILYFAAQSVADDDRSHAGSDEALAASIDLFEASHHALSIGGTMGLSVAGAVERGLSYSDPVDGSTLDALSVAYVADARAVAQGAPDAPAAWSRMRAIGPNDLLRRLNDAVSEFEVAAKDRTRQVERIAHLSFVVALLVLIAEAVVIFWPAQRAVNVTLDRMERANDDLREAKRAAEGAARHAEENRQRAEAARERLTQFVRHMSHELRTPLNGVIGMLTLMDDRGRQDDLDRLIGEARVAADHLLEIVNDTLDLAKLQAGRMELTRKPFAPRELATSIVSIFRAQAQAKDIVLTCDWQDDMPAHLLGDRPRIGQVVANLVVNAIKFTEHGEVRIVLRHVASPGREMLRVEVRDDGDGIAVADRDRLFDPFEQLDAGNGNACRGTGLGLPICRQLVSLMGGTIGMEGNPGEGSCFWFEIPGPKTTADPAATTAISTAHGRDDPGEASLDVLVVDDNRTNLLVATRYLEKLGHRAATAQNGIEALEAIAGGRYDLVLMDIQMPVMDGLTATRKLRGSGDRTAATPVIALTANAMTEDRARFVKSGFDGYLAKPMTLAGLAKALSDIPHRKPEAATLRSARKA